MIAECGVIMNRMRSIVEAVARHAQSQPDKFCLADSRNDVTYREYWECISGYAAHLRELGVGHGDRVVVKNGQNMETAVCGLAIQLLGAVFVPVETKCYISAKPMEVPCPWEKMEEVLSFRDGQADGKYFAYPDAEDTAEILFTTGTTGKSKGIELTHKNVVAVAENVIDGVEMKTDNVEVIPVPLSAVITATC